MGGVADVLNVVPAPLLYRSAVPPPLGTTNSRLPEGRLPSLLDGTGVALSVTVTVCPLSNVPGKRAATTTAEAPAAPETATPGSMVPGAAPALFANTRDTYSCEPPKSKNAFSAIAM